MKNKFMLLVVFVSMAFATGTVQATPYSNVVDFSGGGTNSGRTYLEIGNNSSVFSYQFTHDVAFVPSAASITSAQLVLSHLGNGDNGTTSSNELWFLYGGSATQIGRLLSSSSWVDQTFVLPASLYSAISGGSWTLELYLNESTNGNDKLWIDKSVLSGEYTAIQDHVTPAPVPEPGTVMLLGAGFLGLAVYGKRRKNSL